MSQRYRRHDDGSLNVALQYGVRRRPATEGYNRRSAATRPKGPRGSCRVAKPPEAAPGD
jgi:hypothetical protein